MELKDFYTGINRMGIMKAAFTVGIFTLLSRVVGFLRECLMVFLLSAGMYTDALLVALRLSNTFRRIFAEGAFNSSFLPRFAKIFHEKGKDEANNVLADIFTAMSIIIGIFCIVVIWFFPPILKVLVAGFDVASNKFKITVTLGRICFSYLIFISIASLFAGVLNTINKFALPAAVHSMLSLFTIAGLLLAYFFDLSHLFTVYVVAVFVLLSGFAQSYILYWSIKQNGFFVRFKKQCWSTDVRDVMKNMVPGIIGAGVWQLNLLVDTIVASYFPSGTITCINLADRLNQFPLGTLGIALSTALLPALSKHISNNNYEDAKKELEKGLLLALFPTLFATTVLISLDVPSVAVAFQRGVFSGEQISITARALSGFAVGLPAYLLMRAYSVVYFSLGDTKSPMIFGIWSVLINVICLAIFIPFMKYYGLALCTSVSAISNAVMLIYFCDKKIQVKLSKKFLSAVFSQIFSAVVVFAVLSELTERFWTLEIADHPIKWLMYAGFCMVAAVTYVSIAIISMKILKHPDWKLWKKESWIN